MTSVQLRSRYPCVAGGNLSRFLATVLALGMSTAPSFAGEQHFRLDDAQSWLYVMVFYEPARWTPVGGHDHAIRAMEFDGEVTWDPDDLSACAVRMSFPVTALAVDPDGMRDRAGLPADGAIDDKQKQTVVRNMTAKGQLYAELHPDIRYTSTSCRAAGDEVEVTGTLEIRGVSKSVVAPLRIDVDSERFRARGSFTLGHADFGMRPFTYGPLTPKNREPLEFHLDLVGLPK